MNELYRYLTLAVTAEWRRRPDDERREHKRELAAAVAGNAARVHAYSLVGTRADADVLLWAVADDLEGLRALEVRLAATALWRHSTRPYAYLAARRRSRYLAGHEHADSEQARGTAGPVGDKPYVVIYPMTKKRSWYALPHEERTRIMGAHKSSSSPSRSTTCAASSRSSRSFARRSPPRTPNGRRRSSSAARWASPRRSTTSTARRRARS